MLINLDFLKAGSNWPPDSERKRLKTYKANRQLFEDEHGRVYAEQLKRIERVIGNFSQVISFATILNYQKLMSLKIADLIFGEPPKFTAAKENQQKVIDSILSDTGLLDTAWLAAIDVSRYGDGLLLLGNRNHSPVVEATSPAYWFPVVDPGSIKQIKYHVFGWQFPVDPDGEAWELRVQIHNPEEPQSCEQHTYRLNGTAGAWSIGAEITSEQERMIETQLPVCPVFRVSNVVTSDRVYGIDDYQSIDSIVSELIVRVSQVSRVLDKHANPSMTGPESALESDPNTGEWRFRVGDYYPRHSSDEPALEYVTWDASMDANFKQIDFLINQLYTISEMGSAIFGDLSNKTGEVPSGSALRRLMMSPLAKARRVANKFDGPLKALVSACASIRGENIPSEEISIKWNDGLPDDEVEMANIMAVRTNGKATISQHTAIQRLDGLGDKDAAAELDEIRADEAEKDMGSPPPEEIPQEEEPDPAFKDEET